MTPRTFGRNLLRATVIGAGLAVLTIAGVGLWLWGTLPKLSGSIDVAGLNAPVEIRRDAQGVPRIVAKSANDAYFGLGYAHAQDRFWQMESTRRLGQGRLAEIVGERGLPSDRYQRLLGLYRLAERDTARLPPEIKASLEFYAAGVNAWLGSHNGFLPPEFALLGYQPEPWRVADSLIWLKLMAMRLSGNWRTELLRARLLQKITPEQLEALWPPYPPSAPTTLASAAAPPTTERYAESDIPSAGLDALALADPLPLGHPTGASNGWVVSGERSATGKPILANDPHLAFQGPILWYLARLDAPDLAIDGATFPGFPFHIIGHNGRIAWGMTSVGADMEDLFVERVDLDDKGRYLTPEGSEPFAEREEVIKVKDGADVTVKLRSTRHGPVLTDLGNQFATGQPDTVLALSAVYLKEDLEDRTPAGLLGVNRAGDWASFLTALKGIVAPQQNIFFADAAGNVGYIAPGAIPIRKSGRGRVPSPGWDGKTDWTGYAPFESMPLAFNPPSGSIVNANNPVGGTATPFITDDWEAPERAERLADLLAKQPRHSVDDMAKLQLDRHSLFADRLLPLMMQSLAPQGEREQQALAMLRSWNHEMDRDRPEPLIFTAWLRQLSREIYSDELGPLAADYWNLRAAFVASALAGPQKAWCDREQTEVKETCVDLAGDSLRDALNELVAQQGPDLKAWRWGDLHRAAFRHALLSGIPVLGRLVDLLVATDGADDTINRGSTWIGGPEPYTHIHGAGLRVVYDLAHLDRSRFMIATGQSGNPASPHYDDLLKDWRDGKMLVFGNAASKVLTLTPR